MAVWVCSQCSRVFTEKKRRKPAEPQDMHPIYPELQKSVNWPGHTKMGPKSWCGPIEEWEARPKQQPPATDFYEDDEPVGDVVAAFQEAPKATTQPATD